jgi:hypothetical protein
MAATAAAAGQHAQHAVAVLTDPSSTACRRVRALRAVSSCCLQGPAQHAAAAATPGLVAVVVDQLLVVGGGGGPHQQDGASTTSSSKSSSGSGSGSSSSSSDDEDDGVGDPTAQPAASRIASAAVDAAADLAASSTGRRQLVAAGAVGQLLTLLRSQLLPAAPGDPAANRSCDESASPKRPRRCDEAGAAPELAGPGVMLLAELLLGGDSAPQLGQLAPAFLGASEGTAGGTELVIALARVARHLPAAAAQAAAAVAGRIAMELPLMMPHQLGEDDAPAAASGTAAAAPSAGAAEGGGVLAALLAPVSPDRFFAAHWESEVLHASPGAAAAAAFAAGGAAGAALARARSLTADELFTQIMPRLVRLVDADVDETDPVAVSLPL